MRRLISLPVALLSVVMAVSGPACAEVFDEVPEAPAMEEIAETEGLEWFEEEVLLNEDEEIPAVLSDDADVWETEEEKIDPAFNDSAPGLLAEDELCAEHVWQEVTDTKTPCYEDALIREVCTVCGTVRDGSEKIVPAGHHYGEWVVRVPSTCLYEGNAYRICEVCGLWDYTMLPKIDPTIVLSTQEVDFSGNDSTEQITVEGLGADDDITGWEVADSDVAVVDQFGRITAGSESGETIVTITLLSGKTAEIIVANHIE